MTNISSHSVPFHTADGAVGCVEVLKFKEVQFINFLWFLLFLLVKPEIFANPKPMKIVSCITL